MLDDIDDPAKYPYPGRTLEEAYILYGDRGAQAWLWALLYRSVGEIVDKVLALEELDGKHENACPECMAKEER
jgi:hypothetical protein